MQLIAELKTKDYAKFLATTYASKHLQTALAAIFTYQLEIESIPLEVSEAMVGHVKIQWWREVLTEVMEGKPCRPHPILLALKGQEIDYGKLIVMLDYYDNLLENKLPEKFEELTDFLINTEVAILQVAAKFLNVQLSLNTALAYAYNRMARKLIAKNKPFSDKLFEESKKMLKDPKTSVFGAITSHYNRKPNSANWRLALSLLASKAQLM